MARPPENGQTSGFIKEFILERNRTNAMSVAKPLLGAHISPIIRYFILARELTNVLLVARLLGIALNFVHQIVHTYKYNEYKNVLNWCSVFTRYRNVHSWEKSHTYNVCVKVFTQRSKVAGNYWRDTLQVQRVAKPLPWVQVLCNNGDFTLKRNYVNLCGSL